MTIHPAGTRGDALTVDYLGAEVLMLAFVGAVPGVSPLAVGGACGPGAGQLRKPEGLEQLQWRGPGSSTFGEAIDVSPGGEFLLEDGDDAACWLRVKVTTSFLQSAQGDAAVQLQDQFNGTGPDDVTAAEALAGDVETWTLDLENGSGMLVDGLVAWLDASTVDLEISDDGVSFVAPTTFGTALALGDVLAGASATLHVRRTISAASSSDPDILNLVHLSWEGI